ncbi:MAG: glycosyl hydrolase, partial [Frankia sp.]
QTTAAQTTAAQTTATRRGGPAAGRGRPGSARRPGRDPRVARRRRAIRLLLVIRRAFGRHRRLAACVSVLAVLAGTLTVTAAVTVGAQGMSRPTGGGDADALLVGAPPPVGPSHSPSPSASSDAGGLGASAGQQLAIAPPAGRGPPAPRAPAGGAAGRRGGGRGAGALGAAAGGVTVAGSGTGANAAPAPATRRPAPVVPNPTTQPAPAVTTVAPPAPAPVQVAGGPSGLPWLSGVWTTGDKAGDLAFGAWRGRSLDLVQVYASRDQGWAGITNPWPVSTYAGFAGRLVLSVPTFPQGAGSNAACASGAYNNYWGQLGTFLKSHGRANTIVRLGWEFNGTWMYWHSDPSGQASKGCFQQAAKSMRATDPQILLDWTFTAHGSQVPSSGNPYDAYPGNAYVDFIGIDSYDMAPASPTAAAFSAQCNGSNGMCKAIAFARANGKKLGVGEWGVASCSSSGGGGDNPLYIQKMFATFMANRDVMGYDAYFDDPDAGNVCSSIVNGRQNSKAAAAYKALF